LMTENREAKLDYISTCIPPLEVEGAADADLLIVGWGGTYGHLRTAMDTMHSEGKKVALAHFQYVHPMPANTEEVIRRYKRVVVAEQNLGQFVLLLRNKVPGVDIRQYNRVEGQPFKVQSLVEEFTKIMED